MWYPTATHKRYSEIAMSDHSPAEAARLLGVKDGTLRKYAQAYRTLLSPGAAAGGPTARRRYTDTDIAVLRSAIALLRSGATHDQVRVQLGDASVEDAPPVERVQATYTEQQVTVIEQGSEAVALRQLLDAQRETVTALRETLEAQQAIVAAQGQVIEQQRGQLDSLERGLQQARADEAAALADLRLVLGRIPRWLRSWLRLGV